MIRLLIADDEKMEREALADIVMRRFEHEVTVEMAENGRKAADTAVLWGADLILMGSHGRTGFKKMMLGSVAQNVLTQSPIPVLIVKV